MTKRKLCRDKVAEELKKYCHDIKTLSRQSRGAEGENAYRNKEIHVVTVFVELVEDSYKTTLSR